uniref:Uncharacterized protein n=1 Tax=Oryza punctata TaxID=4537 RepID=A0A0E0JF53_ORYPU
MKDYGQVGAFALWDELSPEDRELLVRGTSRIDRIIRRSLGSQGFTSPTAEPVLEFSMSKVEGRSPEDKERWWKKGLKTISEGKLAVVLLTGGQGTWLGALILKGVSTVFDSQGARYLEVVVAGNGEVRLCLNQFM